MASLRAAAALALVDLLAATADPPPMKPFPPGCSFLPMAPSACYTDHDDSGRYPKYAGPRALPNDPPGCGMIGKKVDGEPVCKGSVLIHNLRPPACFPGAFLNPFFAVGQEADDARVLRAGLLDVEGLHDVGRRHGEGVLVRRLDQPGQRAGEGRQQVHNRLRGRCEQEVRRVLADHRGGALPPRLRLREHTTVPRTNLEFAGGSLTLCIIYRIHTEFIQISS